MYPSGTYQNLVLDACAHKLKMAEDQSEAFRLLQARILKLEQSEQQEREARLRAEQAALQAEQTAQQERAGRLQAEQENEALRYVNAGEFLSQPLETIMEFRPVNEEDIPQIEEEEGATTERQHSKKSRSRSSTLPEKKRFQYRNATQILPWIEFETEMEGLAGFASTQIVDRLAETAIAVDAEFISEGSFQAFWSPPRSTTLRVMKALYPELLTGATWGTHVHDGPAVPDETILKGGYKLFVFEQKHPDVAFETRIHLSDLIAEGEPLSEKTKKKNSICVLIQTYTYMIEEEVKYALFSNWNHWVFLKRKVSDNNKEILYVSNYINLDRARLAWATIAKLAAGELDAKERKEKGEFGQVPRWVITRKKKKDNNGEGNGGGPGQGSATSATSTRRSSGRKRGAQDDQGGGEEEEEEEDEEDEDEEEQDELRMLYPERTTTSVLGIDALSLEKSFEVLAHTNKSHTRRVQVNGQDLVVKLVDFIGIPKQCEFSARELDDMEWTEVRIYHHLRNVQGILVPRFLYHGSDFNHIWATAVTSYEGESLSKLIRQNKPITEDMRAAAIESLRKLHELGVLHGDIELRNVVWRDGRVVWVDFEMASLRNDMPDFDVLAKEEMEELSELLEKVPLPIASEPEVATAALHSSEPAPVPETAAALCAPVSEPEPSTVQSVSVSVPGNATADKHNGSGPSKKKYKASTICPCFKES